MSPPSWWAPEDSFLGRTHHSHFQSRQPSQAVTTDADRARYARQIKTALKIINVTLLTSALLFALHAMLTHTTTPISPTPDHHKHALSAHHGAHGRRASRVDTQLVWGFTAQLGYKRPHEYQEPPHSPHALANPAQALVSLAIL